MKNLILLLTLMLGLSSYGQLHSFIGNTYDEVTESFNRLPNYTFVKETKQDDVSKRIILYQAWIDGDMINFYVGFKLYYDIVSMVFIQTDIESAKVVINKMIKELSLIKYTTRIYYGVENNIKLTFLNVDRTDAMIVIEALK